MEIVTGRGRHRFEIGLLGPHQARNLAHATLAAETLRGLGWERLDPAAVATGARATRWPGRLEVVELPLPEDRGPGGAAGVSAALPRRVLLDVAHNPGAASELAAFLATLPGSVGSRRRAIDLLFGILGDKDAAATLAPLLAATRRRVLTRPPHERGRDPREVAALMPPGTDLEIEPDVAAALEQALTGGAERPADTLFVCGSFYLVGAVRGLLRRRFGVPPPTVD